MMADAENILQFFERGVGMFLNMSLEFLRIQFAPVAPSLFRSERAFFGGVQIAIDGAATQIEPACGLGFGATFVEKLHNPLT